MIFSLGTQPLCRSEGLTRKKRPNEVDMSFRVDDVRAYSRVVVGVALVLNPLHDRTVAPILSHSIRVSFCNVVFS